MVDSTEGFDAGPAEVVVANITGPCVARACSGVIARPSAHALANAFSPSWARAAARARSELACTTGRGAIQKSPPCWGRAPVTVRTDSAAPQSRAAHAGSPCAATTLANPSRQETLDHLSPVCLQSAKLSS